MANFSTGYILTKAGEALAAKVAAGTTTLNITRMKIGDGTTDTMQDYLEQADIFSPKTSMIIGSKEPVEIDGAQICEIKATLDNSTVESGYTATELGLFANDTDGHEILYAVAYDRDPIYIPAKSDATNVTIEFDFYLYTATADQVTLILPRTTEELVSLAQDSAAQAKDAAAAMDEAKANLETYKNAAETAANEAAASATKAENAISSMNAEKEAAAASASEAATSAVAAAQSAQEAKNIAIGQLGFDTEPTEGSSNLVNSDGIYKAIQSKTTDLSNYYTKKEVAAAIATALGNYASQDSATGDVIIGG